ncbi:MAG: hypothetical protein QOF78_3720 [Phycisphaerales bacterium]|jgi:hypothetical protein|nr:hypothetical protein [Phycisphaerales bacterium]MEA2734979.1 hypothetical protein [Humisphaera sp.]
MIKHQRAILYSLFSILLLMQSGCTLLGVAAYKLKPPETVQPKYMGLENKSVGVMVWADRGLRIDWPTIQLDVANTVQKKLNDYQKAKKREAKTLVGTSFPVLPASIVRYQKDHPEIEAMPITDIAPRLGVNRLIYVELEEFATRSEQALALFRGTANATVKVVEIHNGEAIVPFEQNNVKTAFPPKAPPEGIPNAGDVRIYAGTVDALATEIARLFVQYQLEE